MFFLGMPIAASSSMQAMLAAPAPLTTSLNVFDVAARQLERIDEARRRR